MKITRDGKTYQLTGAELQMAYEEYLNNYRRGMIEDAIDRNSENLRFGTEYTMDEFIAECVDAMDDDDWIAEEQRYDDIVAEVAQDCDVWFDGDEDEDEECDC